MEGSTQTGDDVAEKLRDEQAQRVPRQIGETHRSRR